MNFHSFVNLSIFSIIKPIFIIICNYIVGIDKKINCKNHEKVIKENENDDSEEENYDYY